MSTNTEEKDKQGEQEPKKTSELKEERRGRCKIRERKATRELNMQ